MSDYQSALADSTAVQQQQINLFLFDLKNEAAEHGFKDGESWTLELATEQEMTSLKRQYSPIVSIKLQPQALLNVFQQVKSKLQQSFSKDDSALTEIDLIRDEKRHLAAYRIKGFRS